jgi:hypothetical protein
MRVMRLLRVLSSPYPIHRKLRTVRNCNSSRGVWGKPSKSSKPAHTRLAATATPPPIFRSPPPATGSHLCPVAYGGCLALLVGAGSGSLSVLRHHVRPLQIGGTAGLSGLV